MLRFDKKVNKIMTSTMADRKYLYDDLRRENQKGQHK